MEKFEMHYMNEGEEISKTVFYNGINANAEGIPRKSTVCLQEIKISQAGKGELTYYLLGSVVCNYKDKFSEIEGHIKAHRKVRELFFKLMKRKDWLYDKNWHGIDNLVRYNPNVQVLTAGQLTDLEKTLLAEEGSRKGYGVNRTFANVINERSRRRDDGVMRHIEMIAKESDARLREEANRGATTFLEKELEE